MSSMRSALRARLAGEKDAAQPSKQPTSASSSSSSASSSRRNGDTLLEGRFFLRESDASEPTRGTSSATSSPTPRGGLSRWAHRQKGTGGGSTAGTPLASASSGGGTGSGSGKGSLRSSSSKRFNTLADTPPLAPSPLCPTAASGSRRGSTSTSSRHSDTSSFMGSPQVMGSPRVVGSPSPRVLRRGTSLLGEAAPQPASVLFRSLKLESMVGEGRYGTVWRCVDPKTGLQYACKQVDKRRNPKSLKREVECLTRVQSHEGVLRLEGVYESELYLYIVTELCDKGDLFEYLSKTGPLQEADAKALFRQLARALHHCHARGVMHRDIKPENVLLKHSATSPSSQPGAKLADFGLSKRLRPGEMTVGWVGSDPYEAPEVLALKPYDFSADVFSLGVVLFGMLSGTWPTFKEGRTFDAEGEFAWPGWRRISQEARDLLAGMLSHDPSARPTMEDVVSDTWLTRSTPVAAASSASIQKALSSNGRVQQQQQQQREEAVEGGGVTGEAMPLRPRALQLARAISHSHVSSSDCASETCSGTSSPALAPSNGAAKGVAPSLLHENSLSDVSWAGSDLSSPQSCSEGARLSFELNRELTIT